MGKSKSKRTSGAPNMSKAESASVYAELDQAHVHCLSLIATCTELGKDISNTDLMNYVPNLGKLVQLTETATERLVALKSELEGIRKRDLSSRSAVVGTNNIMRLLAAGQEYEQWMGRFGRSVSPTMDAAYALIDEARAKRNENTGSNA